MEERRSAFKISKGNPTGKRILGSASARLEDNIRMNPNLKEKGGIGLIRARIRIFTALNLRVQ
jgi:hypothetical protein